jgi:methionyl-tRNA formyltransferase
MRVFLIGSKSLSCNILTELIDQGHQVLGVYSRDDEPGMKTWHELGQNSLAELSKSHGIPVHFGMKVNSPESLELLTSLNLDIILSCFWSEIFKESILNIPKLGVYNFHTAFLPKNRGSRPIPWAIIKGEKHCGITVHRMMTGVDNGPIVAQSKVDILSSDNAKTLYEKVVDAGSLLAKKVIADFATNAFTLTLQDEQQATYHPRGEPFGRQINPFWNQEQKALFRRAFDYPPFKGAAEAPAKAMDGLAPKVYVMLGFDCDRPRGIYAFSETGSAVAERKFKSLIETKKDLDILNIKRSYFIAGQFLESMATMFGKAEMVDVFSGKDGLVELGDHTYHHDILKPLPSRPDKKALTHIQLRKEIRLNDGAFDRIFGNELKGRGLRSPLGYHKGMHGQYKSLDVLQRAGISYISTDLRDEKSSLHPKLYDENGLIRQPYRYENGLLEIPAIGWQDTVFTGKSKTPLFETHPKSFIEIISYYHSLFVEAHEACKKYDRDIFIGLTLHPLDNSYYNENRQFFPRIKEVLDEVGGDFTTYGEVCTHYNSTL